MSGHASSAKHCELKHKAITYVRFFILYSIQIRINISSEKSKNKTKSTITKNKFYIKNSKLKTFEEKIKSNIAEINKHGVGSYFYKNFYIEEKELNELFVNFKSIKIQKDQIFENKILDVDNQLLAKIKSELGNELNVSPVDLRIHDTKAVKSLFMNGCLFRVSKNIVISEDQKNQLIEIIDSLPDNFSVTDFKEKSSLTRKHAIPFLEFLDKSTLSYPIFSNS